MEENSLAWKKKFDDEITNFNPNLQVGVFRIILLQRDFL